MFKRTIQFGRRTTLKSNVQKKRLLELTGAQKGLIFVSAKEFTRGKKDSLGFKFFVRTK